jgi:hypothetical protein
VPLARDDFESESTCAWSDAAPAFLDGVPTALTGPNPGDTTGATTATFLAPCTTASAPWEVWEYVPAATGNHSISVLPQAGYDVVLVVRSACRMSSAVQLACVEGFADGVFESTVLPLTAGVPVYLFGGGFQANDVGTYSLSIAPTI